MSTDINNLALFLIFLTSSDSCACELEFLIQFFGICRINLFNWSFFWWHLHRLEIKVGCYFICRFSSVLKKNVFYLILLTILSSLCIKFFLYVSLPHKGMLFRVTGIYLLHCCVYVEHTGEWKWKCSTNCWWMELW